MMAYIKKTLVTVMVICLTFMTTTVFAQSGKEALFGLKKLQARCQAGISYRDYSGAVADAKFPVNLFMEGADAEKMPDLKASINRAMEHYETANLFWTRKMNGPRDDTMLQSGFIWTKSPMGQYISNNYPEAVAIAPTTGINWLLGNPKYYPFDSVLSIMWGKASGELENATALYAVIEGDKSSNIEKLKQENEQPKSSAEKEKLRMVAEQEKVLAEYERVYAENEKLKAVVENEKLRAENERLKAAAENEKLKTENEKLKKQLESMTPKKKK